MGGLVVEARSRAFAEQSFVTVSTPTGGRLSL
jgi:hypothetical protein